MNKKIFVSFSFLKNKNLGFSNGVLECEEPKTFKDIQKLSDRIIEEAKNQGMDIENVIILFWKVLGEEDEKRERENKKNQRAGYFSE